MKLFENRQLFVLLSEELYHYLRGQFLLQILAGQWDLFLFPVHFSCKLDQSTIQVISSRSQQPMYSALIPVSYTHLRAHETRHDLVCRLLLEKKKKNKLIFNNKQNLQTNISHLENT
eukprot:TRINITY_DN16730_c0_g1_i1.p1 TRINITY_DN16730_c0_g1~~TRINITY_DN16730_c0_g1_i1.p1  ORF type:complete len:117 (-),score=6.78 TRINITY_DN16730_c0_g1_i1:8-358(-)